MSAAALTLGLASVSLLAAQPAFSQSRAMEAAEAQFERCVESLRTAADVDYIRCYAARYEEADSRLNARWRHLLGLIDAERYGDETQVMRDTLVHAQRDWIAFKDQACDFYLVGRQGTIAINHHLPRCRIEIVEHRIAEIEAMITNTDPAYYEGRETF